MEDVDWQTTLDADDLRRMTPLVRVRDLKPADVILCRGTAIQSKMINLATGGRYSHAMMWWPDQENGSFAVFAESDKYGVGLTHLPFVTIQIPGVGDIEAVPFGGRYSELLVLRHKSL